MPRTLIKTLFVLLFCLPGAYGAVTGRHDFPSARSNAGSCGTSDGNSFIVLCYHDVRDDVARHYDPDETAVSTSGLIGHFAWLEGHGYRAVSVDDLVQARAGIKKLPPRAVLLTFDDGLKSFYTRVFPLLKLFRYPAVSGLVGKWSERGAGLSVPYGPGNLEAGDFLTREQIAEMDRSGLVEFACHSYDLHRGVPANPYGNLQPAATARVYDPGAGTYEDDTAYKQRIRRDLEKSVAQLKKYTGKAPRIMVWPYGAYNRTAVEIARSLGMVIHFSLAPGVNRVENLAIARRIVIAKNPPLDDFVWLLRHPRGDTDPVRVVQVDLDYVYARDKRQQAANLGRLVERIKRMRINTVFLQAFADPEGDGTAAALYFPNRHLPVRADLFNRAAWQLKTRARVKVFAWLPVLAFDFPGTSRADQWYVMTAHETGPGPSPSACKRLSPFHPRARAAIMEIYEDLAKFADFDGILFHDDAFFSDGEDANPDALDYYRDWGLPRDIAEIRRSPGHSREWTRQKTRFLIDFTLRLKQRVEKYRMPVKTARNIYARPIIEPGSSAWFCQSYPLFLQSYDFTVIMAMPFLEKAGKPHRWLVRLLKKTGAGVSGFSKTIFELQSKNWNTGKPVPTAFLLKQMELLQLNGALNYGYYPDDFINGHPDLGQIRRGISLQTYPYRE